MTPRSLLAVVAALCVLVAACNPGSSGTPSAPAAGSPTGSAAAGECPTSPAPQGTPDGWDVGAQQPSIFPQIINPPGATACGPTRLMFSFLDAQNVPVGAPDRTVEVALYDLGADPANPVMTGAAQFDPVEPTVGVYVFDADFPTAGVWGAEFRTTVGDAAPETIRVGFEVQPVSTVVAIGDPAPSVDTPTLADVGGDVTKISTDDQPVDAFYETSVADALTAKKPFVVVFARTPKFCKTAQCGPTLDRVKPIAAAHPGVTFINVEPYQLQLVDGQLQPVLSGEPPDFTAAPATDAWRLLSEPWVFVVDRDGIVTSSLMLIFSDEELDAAVAAVE